MDRLRTMTSFMRVARAGSYTVAAKQLGVSVALVSRHVADLEARLGVRLVNRSTRSLSLTDEGRRYADLCEQLIDQIERGDGAIVQSGSSPVGTINVSAPKSFGSLDFGDALVAFAKMHPRIRVSVVLEDFSFQPYDFMEQGQDVAIRLSEIRDSSVIGRRVGTLKSVLCASRGYVAREGLPRTLADLAKRPCLAHINLERNDRIWRFRGPRGPVSVKIEGPFLSNSALVLRKAVLADLGIGFLPRYAVDADLAAGRLIPVLPQFRCEERPIVVVHPRATLVPQRVRLFVDFLIEWFGKYEDGQSVKRRARG